MVFKKLNHLSMSKEEMKVFVLKQKKKQFRSNKELQQIILYMNFLL